MPLPAATGASEGLQVVLPEMVFQPGEDMQRCYFTSLPITETVWVSGFDALQGKGGHHLILFSTVEDVPDGTVADCNDGARMKFWQLLMTPASKGSSVELPQGYALKLEPGRRLVLQSHYINTSEVPIRTRDVLQLRYHRPQQDIVAVGPFATGITDYVIPAKTTHSERYECGIPQDMNVTLLFGHMHEHGSSIEVSLGTAGQPGQTRKIYGVEQWRADYRDAPPLTTWPYGAPFELKAGETVSVRCTWNNTLDAPMGFPREMCAAVFFFHPADKPLTCSGVRVE